MPVYSAVLSNFNNSLWGYFLPVSKEQADEVISGKTDRRVVCTINDRLTFQCALMPYGDGSYFILINQENRKKLGLRLGQEVYFSLEKDDSDYGLPMPEEMAAVMTSDPEGNELFHALTPGKQRNLLYIVGKVKSSELRIHKALVVIEHLKQQGGKINFKLLYEELKPSNRKW